MDNKEEDIFGFKLPERLAGLRSCSPAVKKAAEALIAKLTSAREHFTRSTFTAAFPAAVVAVIDKHSQHELTAIAELFRLISLTAVQTRDHENSFSLQFRAVLPDGTEVALGEAVFKIEDSEVDCLMAIRANNNGTPLFPEDFPPVVLFLDAITKLRLLRN